MIKTEKTDVVIVGSGAGGLFSALKLAEAGLRVTVLSEKALGGLCASALAQGGIAAAVGDSDSVASHVADTLHAAAGTADINAVKTIVAAAPAYVDILESYGVRFARDAKGRPELSREACHAARRVLKAEAADGFGAELMRALSAAVEKTANIVYVGDVSAERLVRSDAGGNSGRVRGVLCKKVFSGETVLYQGRAVILATGGVGGLYAMTSNPLHAIGRGIAMAARAGAVLSDLEFVQFHPTVLDIGEDPAPLATEALRGEGAYLLNSRGERFMKGYDKMAELAPRDVVSRGSFAQIQKGQKVYLDCRHIDTSRFPALRAAAARAGLDPVRDLIPVMPAVHYHMGGIATDLDGRASIGGLWAVGECAATGLHGANRLASNSLLEALVMAGRAAEDIGAFLKKTPDTANDSIITLADLPRAPEPDPARDVLRQLMTQMVGVIRDEGGLLDAIDSIGEIERAAENRDAKTADMALVAKLIAVAALKRTESRGGHCRSDYPQAVGHLQKRSFITLKEAEALIGGGVKRKKQMVS